MVLHVHRAASRTHTQHVTSHPTDEEVRDMSKDSTQRTDEDEVVPTSVSNPRRVRL